MANSWRAEYSEMGGGYGGSRIMDCAGNITAAEKGKASMYVRGRTYGWWSLCRCLGRMQGNSTSAHGHSR